MSNPYKQYFRHFTILDKTRPSDTFFASHKMECLHKFGDGYVISTISLPMDGYYCPTCGKDQPFEDWWCLWCNSPSVVGEPLGERPDMNMTEEQHDAEFESYFDNNKVKGLMEFIGKTKRGNYLYKIKE